MEGSGLARLRARDAERLRRYQELLDFYDGAHFTRARRGRTSLVVNYTRAVADKGVSYLFGRGVRFSVPDSAPAERLLNRLAAENDLDLLLLQAATNASVLGDAVLKLVWDPSVRRVRVLNVDPFGFFPTWGSDTGRLREVALAGQLSLAEAQERYGPELGEAADEERREPQIHADLRRWIPNIGMHRRSAAVSQPFPAERMLDTLECWTPTRYRLFVGERLVREGPNPYGFIPFVHVANLQPSNSFWGESDLTHLIPLNRELDERMSDQADLIRYHADPPIVFRGVEEHSDLPVGPGTVWDLPRDADVALLEWRGNTPAVQDHIDRVLRAIYDVSETPRTSFGDSGRLLSGVALETELQPLVHRTLRKRVGWTAALRACARTMLLLTVRFGLGGTGEGLGAEQIQVVWPQMLPRDDDADVQRNLTLVQAGLRSHHTAMAELGELDPESELERVRKDRVYLARVDEEPQMHADEHR